MFELSIYSICSPFSLPIYYFVYRSKIVFMYRMVDKVTSSFAYFFKKIKEIHKNLNFLNKKKSTYLNYKF